MSGPSPEAVRAALADLDLPRQKIVTGLLAVMIQNASRVRDREWIAGQLTQVVVLAGGFEADTPDEGVRAVQEFLEENAAELLSTTYLLFQRVALDLEDRAEDGFTFEDAIEVALDYLPR